MRTLAWLLLLCSPVLAQTPPQASNAGFNTLAFDSVGNIDISNTQASGFSWYIGNWFGQAASDPSNVSALSGQVRLGGGTSGTIAQLSSALPNGSGGYVGQVFSGGGYFEIEFSTNAQNSVFATDWPNFFLEPLEHILQNGSDQWVGQATGYAHFAELDVVELIHSPMQDVTTSPAYLIGAHDWSGVFSGGYPYNIVFAAGVPSGTSPINWGARNKYGLLWVTQTSSAPAYLSWYFNDQLMATIYYAGPVTSPPLSGQSTGSYAPTTTSQASQTYAVADGEHFAMRMGTDPAWPMTVYSVKVWQK